MKVYAQSHQILDDISPDGMDELRKIELIGRMCYKSENPTMDDEKTKTFVRNLIKNGHESVIEHGKLSVIFTTDRGVTHELVRHRLASYTQESTRYCNYSLGKFGHEIAVVKPVDIDVKDPAYAIWRSECAQAEAWYFDMLEAGCKPEQARAVLPTCLKADICVTANYREWRHILKLRTGKGAHPQIRALMTDLLEELQQRIPVIFDDIEPYDEVFDKFYSEHACKDMNEQEMAQALGLTTVEFRRKVAARGKNRSF